MSVSIEACSQPNGYVSDSTDCNDNNDNSFVGAIELCDSEDNDCDGTVDEEAGIQYYFDADEDGYGDLLKASSRARNLGYVSNMTDCNDGSALVSEMRMSYVMESTIIVMVPPTSVPLMKRFGM